MDKKILIFGTGKRSREYSVQMDLRPVFYLDNNRKKIGKSFMGVPILSPEEIVSWEEYFIVIAVDQFEAIKQQLEGYGLKNKIDFDHYTVLGNAQKKLEFFEKELLASIEYVKRNVNELKATALIFSCATTFDSNFIPNMNRLYQQCGQESFLYLSETLLEQEKRINIEFPFFLLPEMLWRDFNISKSYMGNIHHDSQKEKYISERDFLYEAYENLEKKNPEVKHGSNIYIIYYYDIFLRAILDQLNPKYVFMWNQFYPFHMILDKICKEKYIKTIYLEYGSLPGTYAIDECGQMGESYISVAANSFVELPVSKEEIDEAERTWDFLFQSGLNRNVQPKNNAIDIIEDHLVLDQPIILYAGQNDFESGMYPYTERTRKYHSPVFKSSEDALMYLAMVAKKHNWNLIYKPHPLCLKNIGEIPDNVILLESCDINDIIDFADVTITILSQVGYISTIRRKPTVMLGYMQLKGKGCTYEAFSKNCIESTIMDALENGFTKEKEKNFRKHIAQLTKYYLYDNQGTQKCHFGRKLYTYVNRLKKGKREGNHGVILE